MISQLLIIKVFFVAAIILAFIAVKAYLDSRAIIIRYRQEHYKDPRILKDPFTPTRVQRFLNTILTLKSSFK